MCAVASTIPKGEHRLMDLHIPKEGYHNILLGRVYIIPSVEGNLGINARDR